MGQRPKKVVPPGYRKSVAQGYVPVVLCVAFAVYCLFVGDDLNHYVFAPILGLAAICLALYVHWAVKKAHAARSSE